MSILVGLAKQTDQLPVSKTASRWIRSQRSITVATFRTFLPSLATDLAIIGCNAD